MHFVPLAWRRFGSSAAAVWDKINAERILHKYLWSSHTSNTNDHALFIFLKFRADNLATQASIGICTKRNRFILSMYSFSYLLLPFRCGSRTKFEKIKRKKGSLLSQWKGNRQYKVTYQRNFAPTASVHDFHQLFIGVSIDSGSKSLTDIVHTGSRRDIGRPRPAQEIGDIGGPLWIDSGTDATFHHFGTEWFDALIKLKGSLGLEHLPCQNTEGINIACFVVRLSETHLRRHVPWTSRVGCQLVQSVLILFILVQFFR